MKKDILKTIKDNMQKIQRNKKEAQSMLQCRLNELEIERKNALVGSEDTPELKLQINERFDSCRIEIIDSVYALWHNNEAYYIIYEDGNDVAITAEEILSGEPFPEMSHIAYAEMCSADEHMDTETGDIHWYSDERMEACAWNYEAEDQAKWEYETAIQFKFGTAWARQWQQKHPEFVPMELNSET